MGELFRFIENPTKYFEARRLYQKAVKEYIASCDVAGDHQFPYCSENDIHIYFDRYKEAGNIDGHYFLQDYYMAQKVINNQPVMHFDIASRLDGFLSHLLVNKIPTTMIDIRPLSFELDGLSFIHADATNLEGIADESIPSISSLHAIEHFGLGRYGDTVDAGAWRKALHSMLRVTQKNGYIYISVPIGPKDKVRFNAHRIFSIDSIPNEVGNEAELINCAYIKNYQIIDVMPSMIGQIEIIDDYLCGLYVFRKI